VSGHVRLLVDGNVVDPALGAFATVPEMIPIIAGTENLLEPAIFLLPLDVASADPVDPATTSIITSSRFIDGLSISEPVTLTIPPGHAIDDATGLPFVGDIHISRVTDPTKGPRPLPEEFDLSVYIAIQPFGVTYPTPVPISFPNVEDFPPGSRLDFFALDHDTGLMEKIGEGLVSADGKTVDSIGGVVKSNSWHGIVPQGPVVTPTNPPGQNEPGDNNGGYVPGGGNNGVGTGTNGGSDGTIPGLDDGENEAGPNPAPAPSSCPACVIYKETGNLKEWHTITPYHSLQKTRSIRFEYNSNNANPQPVIPLISGFGNQAPPPNLMSMRINVDGIEMGKEVFSEIRVETSEIRGQFKTTRPAIQFNASMIDTGIYNYELDVNCYFPISRRQETVTDQVIIHNERNSSFGAGWTIAGLQRIHEHISGSVMLTEGTATSSIFEPMNPLTDPNGFESPPGDFSTLVRLGDGTLERRMKDGMRFRFDSAGLMIANIDRNNNLTAYNYDATQRLTSIVDPVNESFTLTYAAGKISSISDPLGRTTRFQHDSEGNLIAIIEPNGDRREFEYSQGNNLMIAQIDQRHNRTQYFYNFAGRIIEALLPDGSKPQFDLGQTKGLANLAPEGQPGDGSRLLPTEAPLLEEEVTNKFNDHNGNEIIEKTDRRHKPIRLTDSVNREYIFERDEDSNLTRRIRPNTSEVVNTFDNLGNLTSKIEQFNSAQYLYEYDSFSLGKSATNPNNHTTTFNRDPSGNLTSIVNHLGHTITYEHDSRGLITRTESPNQLVVTFTHNTLGLVEAVTETPPPNSPGNIRVWQYKYDAAGQMIQTVTPDGIMLEFDYDSKGRRSRVRDSLNQIIEYTYDAYNNLIKTDAKNSDGSLARTIQGVFDTRNRYVESVAPHQSSENSIAQRTLDNNSNIIGLVDPNGNDSSSVHDAEDRLIQKTHRLNGVTRYEYDTNDRIVKVSGPTGVVTSYTYDVLGRRLSETSADRGIIQYTYDLNNNLKSVTDGRGIVATMEYDELERVISKSYPGSISGKNEDVIYIYDSCTFGTGKLCQRIDESGTWNYEYDAFGNMVEETRVELGVTHTTTYQYDEGNNIVKITYPTGRVVNYDRDAIRRIENISSSINGINSEIVGNLNYRADNLIVRSTFGNGLVDDRSYDLQGRLLSQDLGTIDSRVYSYDKNSNMLSRNTTLQNSVYSYDKMDRLIGDEIDGDSPFNYQYDLNHNRLSKSQLASLGENYGYDPGTNRIVRHVQFTTGSLPPTVVDRQYVYSDTNRIFQVIDNGLLNAEYIYNDLGVRSRKTVYDHSVSPASTVVTIYHYDLSGNLIGETDENGVPRKDYIWNGRSVAAQIDISASIDVIHYLHTDHMMTPRFSTDSNQQVTWSWEGEAFGNTEAQDILTEVNLRFPGQYYDSETGEHYNWNRYFQPKLGRYLSSDPIGLGGGGNTYGYTNANPINNLDSSGLSCSQVYSIPIGYSTNSTTSYGDWGDWSYTTHNLDGGSGPFPFFTLKCACARTQTNTITHTTTVTWSELSICFDECDGDVYFDEREYDEVSKEIETDIVRESDFVWGGMVGNETSAFFTCQGKCNGLN
ncbi:MAG: hypothetical protein DRI70_01505, partial [Bacteroidetes bacterium]